MRRRYSVTSKFRKPLSLDGLFYSHGLMCASHPRSVIALVAVVVIVCRYVLVNLSFSAHSVLEECHIIVRRA